MRIVPRIMTPLGFGTEYRYVRRFLADDIGPLKSVYRCRSVLTEWTQYRVYYTWGVTQQGGSNSLRPGDPDDG
jgi:hypothetical protein